MSGCQAGTLTAIIGETGDIRPCEILDTKLGNLRDHEYDFMTIWKSALADNHRQNQTKPMFLYLRNMCQNHHEFSTQVDSPNGEKLRL